MAKVTKALPHLTEAEINEKIKSTVGFWRVQRWLIIRQALINPKTAEEIALNYGVAEQTVHNLIAAYNRYGSDAVETPGKGQRQKAYLTIEEEKRFLEPYIKKAEKGHLTSVNQIHIDFEKHLGHSIAKSTTYRLLDRQNWRKITPRTKHPKSNNEIQENFKKTSKRKSKK